MEEGSGVRLKLPCHPRPVTAKHLIASPDHLPTSLLSPVVTEERRTTVDCIAVLSSLPEAIKRRPPVKSDDDEEGAEEKDDTAVVLFPPEDGRQLVRALITGEGTGSCPSGQCRSFQLVYCPCTKLKPIHCSHRVPLHHHFSSGLIGSISR